MRDDRPSEVSDAIRTQPPQVEMRGLGNLRVVSTTAFDRRMQRGRAQGGLNADDKRQALPVDTMTAAELADVRERLEDAGLSIEIDAALLAPRHRETGLRHIIVRVYRR